MTERQTSYSYEELILCGKGELFGQGNAQLPAPPMLMFDRITQLDEEGGEYGKGMIRAEFDIKPDAWFFPCHFIGNEIMPGCLGAAKVMAWRFLLAKLSLKAWSHQKLKWLNMA